MDRRASARKELLEFLRLRPEGASMKQIASNLRTDYNRTKSLIWQLEKAGEVFRKGNGVGGIYCSAAAALAFDPKPAAERMRQELESSLFGGEPPDWVREFAAGLKMGLSIEESWYFAKRKIRGSSP